MARILLVDDEPSVREALGGLVELLGHECVCAADGLEALEHLHTCDFDAVLSDVLMPRMNGFQLLERILPYIGERLPFVILSSVRTEAEIRDALFAGAFDYLTKPCDIEDVEAVLERALAHRRKHRGPRRLRGGPVPAEALHVDPAAVEAASDIPIRSGIPVFRQDPKILSIAPPDEGAEAAAPPASDEEPAAGLSALVRRLFGGRPKKRRAG